MPASRRAADSGEASPAAPARCSLRPRFLLPRVRPLDAAAAAAAAAAATAALPVAAPLPPPPPPPLLSSSPASLAGTPETLAPVSRTEGEEEEEEEEEEGSCDGLGSAAPMSFRYSLL
ncbi:unnamed protein product [Ectocarpus sp. 4 AP-2014]